MWIVVGEFLFLVKKSLKTRKQISTFLLSLLEIWDMDSIFLFLFSILASHQCLVYADRITTPHSAMIFGFHWGNIFQKPVKFLASVNFQKIQLQEYHGTRDCLYLCQPIRSWYESRLQLNGAIPLFCTEAQSINQCLFPATTLRISQAKKVLNRTTACKLYHHTMFITIQNWLKHPQRISIVCISPVENEFYGSILGKASWRRGSGDDADNTRLLTL